MIRRFADKHSAAIFAGLFVTGLPSDIQMRARARLKALNAATELGDLRAPPGNRLESLRGDRKGQHSIRINDQYRICFRWETEYAFEVEIADYH